MRVPALGALLRRAGLTDARTQTTLVERSAPLGPPERQFWADVLAYSAPLGRRTPVPAERERLLDDPDFSCCEGHVVVVGTVP